MSAGKGLDILSEDVDYLPYDWEALDFELPFANFEPSEDFDMLEMCIRDRARTTPQWRVSRR